MVECWLHCPEVEECSRNPDHVCWIDTFPAALVKEVKENE